MVQRCRAQGVNIYVDAVINHMTGQDRSGTMAKKKPHYIGHKQISLFLEDICLIILLVLGPPLAAKHEKKSYGL